MNMDISGTAIRKQCFYPSEMSPEIGFPKVGRVPKVSTEMGRTLYLSGKWQMPGSEFRLEAVLMVLGNGAAEGVINWRNVRTGGFPATFSGTEYVSGQISQFHVEIHGYRAASGLATDSYKVVLCGSDTAGYFNGSSRAYGGWDGRMSGSYRFSSVES